MAMTSIGAGLRKLTVLTVLAVLVMLAFLVVYVTTPEVGYDSYRNDVITDPQFGDD